MTAIILILQITMTLKTDTVWMQSDFPTSYDTCAYITYTSDSAAYTIMLPQLNGGYVDNEDALWERERDYMRETQLKKDRRDSAWWADMERMRTERDEVGREAITPEFVLAWLIGILFMLFFLAAVADFVNWLRGRSERKLERMLAYQRRMDDVDAKLRQTIKELDERQWVDIDDNGG